jgi:hypothetical protein
MNYREGRSYWIAVDAGSWELVYESSRMKWTTSQYISLQSSSLTRN